MKYKLIIPLAAILLTGICGAARASVITAADGSFFAVKLAVASASPGDTVIIPPGTNSWPGILYISGITLQGSGTNNTVIVDESPAVGNGSPLIQISTTDSALTRVTQIQFTLGVKNTFPFANYNGTILAYGDSPRLRIDHCVFYHLDSKPIHIASQINGVIDHCAFLMHSVSCNPVEVDGISASSPYGDESWATPYVAGSSNALFIEDNYIYSDANFCCVDVSNGGRAVYRHNVGIGAYFNTHGAETSQRYRSARYVEVYDNTFIWPNGTNPAVWMPGYTMVDIRGGSAVIFSNTAAGYSTVAELNYYRATDNDSGFLPWYGATGSSGWDNNSPVALSGICTGPTTNVLHVANANWTPNQWVGYTVYDLNTKLQGVVAGNTADTMSFYGSRRAWLQVQFTGGDSFQVCKVIQGIDQPGAGQGDLLTGDNPAPRWLNQVRDPVYAWGNVNQATPHSGFSPGGIVPIVPGWFVEGRDYVNGVKPGYKPFTYPHPLTLITDAVAPVDSGSNPPTSLSPPTGLNVHGL